MYGYILGETHTPYICFDPVILDASRGLVENKLEVSTNFKPLNNLCNLLSLIFLLVLMERIISNLSANNWAMNFEISSWNAVREHISCYFRR